MAVSASTDNYQIGKGIVSFSEDDGATFRDIRMVMDEITAANLALMALGDVDTDTDGNSAIKSLQLSSKEGIIRFQGTNDVGLQVNFIGKVSFTPSGSFNMISEEWNTLEVTGEMVTTDAYGLGLWTIEDVLAVGIL